VRINNESSKSSFEFPISYIDFAFAMSYLGLGFEFAMSYEL